MPVLRLKTAVKFVRAGTKWVTETANQLAESSSQAVLMVACDPHSTVHIGSIQTQLFSRITALQHEHCGLGHQRSTNGQHLLFAPGESACFLLVALLQAREKAENALSIHFDFRFVFPSIGTKSQIFVDTQVGEYTATFRNEHNAGFDNGLGFGAEYIPADAV